MNIISEEYDFAMNTLKGLEVGVITTRDLEVRVFYVEHETIVETDAQELFEDDDWIEYATRFDEINGRDWMGCDE